MAWLDSATILDHYAETDLIHLTDDSADPSAIDAGILSAAISRAIDEAQAILCGRYPTETAAQTASPTVSAWVADLAVGHLARRRPGESAWFDARATDAHQRLDAVAEGRIDVYGWSGHESVYQGKIEPPAESDVWDYAAGPWDVPSEHEADER